MRLRIFGVITAVIAMIAASLVVANTIAGAVRHSSHEQRERDRTPADYSNGADRGNPNGANGTIKIDGMDINGRFDNHPNNEPHVSCVFQVDLYGFDGPENGDIAQLEFRHWNPSNTQVEVLALAVADDPEGSDFAPIYYQDEGFNRVMVPLDSDGAGGGVDTDRQVTIRLEIPDTDPGAGGNHGHHVRLDAWVSSSAHKHDYKKTKVFWVGDCKPQKPLDCALVDGLLTWYEAPFATTGFTVLLDGVEVATLDADATSYDYGYQFGEFTVVATDVAGRTFSTKGCIVDPPPAPPFDCATVGSLVSWDPVDGTNWGVDITYSIAIDGVDTTTLPAGTLEYLDANGQDVTITATWVDGTVLSATCSVPLFDCAAVDGEVTWVNPPAGVTGYSILLDGAEVGTADATATSFDPGTNYGTFTVVATNSNGTEFTSVSTCEIDPPPAPAFECDNVGSLITWTEVDGSPYGETIDYSIAIDGVDTATVPAGTLQWEDANGESVTITATWVDGTVLTDTCTAPKFECGMDNPGYLGWINLPYDTVTVRVLLDGVLEAEISPPDMPRFMPAGFGQYTLEAVQGDGDVYSTEATDDCVNDAPPAPDFDCVAVQSVVTWDLVATADGSFSSDYTLTFNGVAETIPAGTTEWTDINGGGGTVTVSAVWVDGTVLTSGECTVLPAD